MRRTIVVTRPRAQSKNLLALLRRSGARVVCAPLVRIAPPRSYKRLDAAIRRLETYDAVAFTSVNAVEHFFKRLDGFRPLKRPRLWAVGPATAAALRARGLRPAPLPPESTGEALARSMRLRRGARVLLPRAERARPELPAGLRRRGAVVSVAPAYRAVGERLSPAARAALGSADAVAFGSSSAVEQLRRQLGASRFRALFRRATAASIGPTTTSALEAAGAEKIVQAAAASDAALAEALR